jgi:inositol oxygenase
MPTKSPITQKADAGHYSTRIKMPRISAGAYTWLMNDKDLEMLPWLQLFQRYDLYSKTEERLDIKALMPYYRDLVGEFFPEEVQW